MSTLMKFIFLILLLKLSMNNGVNARPANGELQNVGQSSQPDISAKPDSEGKSLNSAPEDEQVEVPSNDENENGKNGEMNSESSNNVGNDLNATDSPNDLKISTETPSASPEEDGEKKEETGEDADKTKEPENSSHDPEASIAGGTEGNPNETPKVENKTVAPSESSNEMKVSTETPDGKDAVISEEPNKVAEKQESSDGQGVSETPDKSTESVKTAEKSDEPKVTDQSSDQQKESTVGKSEGEEPGKTDGDKGDVSTEKPEEADKKEEGKTEEPMKVSDQPKVSTEGGKSTELDKVENVEAAEKEGGNSDISELTEAPDKENGADTAKEVAIQEDKTNVPVSTTDNKKISTTTSPEEKVEEGETANKPEETVEGEDNKDLSTDKEKVSPETVTENSEKDKTDETEEAVEEKNESNVLDSQGEQELHDGKPAQPTGNDYEVTPGGKKADVEDELGDGIEDADDFIKVHNPDEDLDENDDNVYIAGKEEKPEYDTEDIFFEENKEFAEKNREKLEQEIKEYEEKEEKSQGHFFAFLLVTMFVSAALYLVYHNKRKVIGLILPGNQRRTGSRQRGYKANYERLDKQDSKSYSF